MKKYDFVFINRKHKKSSIINKRLNFYQVSRYIIGYFVSLIVRVSLGLNIQGGDTQSGLKAFKKLKILKIKILFQDYFFEISN